MKCVLTKKPKKATIISGFPSAGLVSTIATKYLLDHLKAEQIGYITTEEQAPLVAIHKGELVQPITLYHNKKFNLIIIQSLTEVTGLEWKTAEILGKVCKDLEAKELIILESTPTRETEINVTCFANKKAKAIKFVQPLKNAILMGLTSAILLKVTSLPVYCLFAEVHSNLPEHEAAAKVVEDVSKYLGLKVDLAPLHEEAQTFGENLKKMVEQKRTMQAPAADKQSYIG